MCPHCKKMNKEQFKGGYCRECSTARHYLSSVFKWRTYYHALNNKYRKLRGSPVIDIPQIGIKSIFKYLTQ